MTLERTHMKMAAGALRALASRRSVQFAAILAAAVVLCLPCLVNGLPRGYDSTTHVNYLHHFSAQFWSGDLYPRWLAEANKGCGSPIFLIQYPFPYLAASLVRGVDSFPIADREGRELGLCVFLAVLASGFSTRFWLRGRTRSSAATLAALVYMALPYTLSLVYVRAAIGEVWALAWMPLALGLSDRTHERPLTTIPLGGALALLLTSNVLIFLLFAPLLVPYAFARGREALTPARKTATTLAVAFLLGLGFSGSYLLPLVAYRHLFDLRALVANLPGWELGRWFLFVTPAALDGYRVLRGVAMTAALAIVAAWYIAREPRARARGLMWLTLGLSAATLVPGLGPRVIRLGGQTVTSFDEFNHFAPRMMVGFLASAMVGLLAYCRAAATERAGLPERVLLGGVAVAVCFAVPFSVPLWTAMPALSVLQFPFRFGSVLSLAVTGLVAVAVDTALDRDRTGPRRPAIGVLALATLAMIGGGAYTWLIDQSFREPNGPRWELSSDVDVSYRMYVPPAQLPAFAQVIGSSPGSHKVVATTKDGTLRIHASGCEGTVEVWRESPRRLRVRSDCREGGTVRIGQLYSPLWKLERAREGTSPAVLGSSAEGLLEVTVRPGAQEAVVAFDAGWPERWGNTLTGTSVTLAAIVVAAATLRRRRGRWTAVGIGAADER